MAVKKTTKKKDESASPTKAEAKETAPQTTAKPKKSAAPKAAAPTPEPVEASKAAPKKATAAATAPKKAASAKKAAPAPIKLSASQTELLKKIGETSETGYTVGKKVEQRSVDALLEKKLIKKGAKDKATGSLRYHISSAGKKHAS